MSNWTWSQVGQRNDHLGQNETSNQIEQNKMTSFVKINNGVIIKWNILCYLIGQDSYQVTKLGNSVGLLTYQLIYLHTYPPTILQTYLRTYLFRISHLPSYILACQPTYLHTYLPPTSHLPSYIPAYLLTYLPTYFLFPTNHQMRGWQIIIFFQGI
jgi:hypothetical protein